MSSSGFGDGSYTCLYNIEDNKINAIRIIFINEDKNEDEEIDNEQIDNEQIKDYKSFDFVDDIDDIIEKYIPKDFKQDNNF